MKKLFSSLLAVCLLGMTAEQVHADSYEDCLLQSVKSADSELTAGEMRRQCEAQGPSTTPSSVTAQADQESAIEQRLRLEFDAMDRAYSITTHQPNYAIVSYNDEFDAANSIYAQVDEKFGGLKKQEIKYQVSMKMPVWRNMFHSSNDLYFGYTQTSWWQLFADQSEISAPFRETNYEPELFLRHFGGPKLPFGGNITGFDVGIVHQSNGRSEELSRSWNRLMGRVGFDYGDLQLTTRLWYRLPEDEDEDDNPGEQRYFGYGDIRATWAPNKNTISAMWRPGTDESGFELTWSYPITKSLRVYGQWWYGYGESLIDYDQKVNRIGIGIALSDWLMRNSN